jgi:hypothetical protein
MSEERVFLTVDEAIAMLPDRDIVHVVTGGVSPLLLGADWDRQDVIDLFQKAPEHGIEIAGDMAAATGHKIACFQILKPGMGHYVFVETKGGEG